MHGSSSEILLRTFIHERFNRDMHIPKMVEKESNFNGIYPPNNKFL
jgi:hypothetical protein